MPPKSGKAPSVEQLAAGVLMIGFSGMTVPGEVAQLAGAGVRNFILFGRNVGSRTAVRILTDELRSLAGEDALIAIDHEGGRVMRLTQAATHWPAPMAWAATGEPELVERAARIAAEELASLGINLNFAPVADVLGDYRNPVLSTRCFSDDPYVTAELVSRFVRGHQADGVAATAKHFPGHGHTPVDSHTDLPQVHRSSEELEALDMLPFAAAARAGVDCMMISHVWYTGLDAEPTPASTSSSVVRLARETLGYEGVIVTDSMEMGAIQRTMTVGEAVVRAIASGADLAIVSHGVDRQQEVRDALVAAARDGRVSLDRLQEANRRLSELQARVQRKAKPWPGRGAGLAKKIARDAVTLVRDDFGILPLRASTLGILSFTAPATQAEDNASRTVLGMLAKEYVERVVEAPSDGGREGVLRQLEGVDAVILGTARASQSEGQAEIVQALLQAKDHVVVVALRDPYDLLAYPEASCFLVAYGEGEVETRAALDVVFGRSEPRGQLPVSIPGLYPRGHGVRSFTT